MNSGPGRIWWRGDHARLNKWWRCSLASISKSILDRHHQSKLKLKFNICLSNLCHQNFQNIVTWGVELRSRNTIFACIPMESLFSGVLPWQYHRLWIENVKQPVWMGVVHLFSVWLYMHDSKRACMIDLLSANTNCTLFSLPYWSNVALNSSKLSPVGLSG